MNPWASPRSARRRRAIAVALTAGLVAGMLALGAAPAPAVDAVVEVPALVETTPSDVAGDSVDDPAIWVDPADPARSVIIGADHRDKGLSVYDLSGSRIQELPLSSANNVDVRSGFFRDDVNAGLVGVAGSGNVSFHRLDPATRTLANVTVGGPKVGIESAHGICLYRSPISSTFYAFVVNRHGILHQYELTDDAGRVAMTPVRDVTIEPRGAVPPDEVDPLEGCVADDVGASVFVGEQDWHIWRIGAEPTDGADRVKVDSDVSEGGHFTRDVEGLAVVNTPSGGFLLASSQGDYTYNVYRSTAPYEFIRKVKVGASATADGCERTDGIDAVAANLGPAFPQGVFVCQDNYNDAPAPAGNMNFKYVRLETIIPLDTPAPDPQPDPRPHPPTDPPPQSQPPPILPAPAAATSGYWMLDDAGHVYAFGGARHLGDQSAVIKATPSFKGSPTKRHLSVDIEPVPTGDGYWITSNAGSIDAFGTARGRVFIERPPAVLSDDEVTSISATPSGNGLWVFASDGGIFSFGDARFYGSMGGKTLNAPVKSLVPDPDGTGYWLVASDGGVFAFEAGFRGSMGATPLNRPVTGMVPYGRGYLMVGEDGGIFNFSDGAFAGSLGATPPPDPITSVAALG